MKKRNRLLAILLAFAMVLAFMPAMVFAEDEIFTAGYNGAVVDELSAAGAETVSADAKNFIADGTVGCFEMIINDNGTVDLYGYTAEAQSYTTLTIPDIVTYGGKSYPVTSINAGALKGLNNLTSGKVPASVTQIGDAALGYTNTNTKVPGFTIIGTTGTAAQIYASANGFVFSDPVAEAIAAAEAARQGVPDAKIPKLKTSKPTAG